MSKSEHRVSSHLQLAVDDYDRLIRRWIPGYEAMLDTIVGILDARLPAEPVVLDLGAGTGALGGTILERIPRARVRMLDIDPAMLEVCATRTAGNPRAELVRGSFDDAIPPCDAIVATLSLHHIPERPRKTGLYERARRALRPGGVLLVGDAVVHPEGAERAWIYDGWARHMAASGIARAEADKLFAAWADEDFYNPLSVELAMLAEAGFVRPDVFSKVGPIAVYGAFA